MQVTVTVNTIAQQFSGGTVGGDWVIQAALATDPATTVEVQQGPNTSVTWELLDSTGYVFSATRLDASGNALGPVAILQHTVGAGLVSIDVADTISVTEMPGLRRGVSSGRRK